MTFKWLRFFYAGIILSSALSLSGCYSRQYGYPMEEPKLVKTSLEPFSGKTVSVIDFRDMRPPDNHDFFLFWLVPGFPYGFGEYERPETADFFTSISEYKFNPPKDLARAASTSFEEANIFSSVLYGGEQGKYDTDLILEGEIYSTQYTGRRFSYCVSFANVIFWTLGAPMGTSYNKLELALQLKNKKGDILWSYHGSEDDYVVEWMFSPYDDCKKYPILTGRIFNKAVMDLYNFMLRNPEVFH